MTWLSMIRKRGRGRRSPKAWRLAQMKAFQRERRVRHWARTLKRGWEMYQDER